MGSGLNIEHFTNRKAENDLLRRDRRLSCSQNVFLNLAGRSLGKFFDEGDAVRRLEMREVRPRKLAQLAFLSVRALLKNDEGVRRFAPTLVREPDDRDLLYGRVSQKDTFH